MSRHCILVVGVMLGACGPQVKVPVGKGTTGGTDPDGSASASTTRTTVATTSPPTSTTLTTTPPMTVTATPPATVSVSVSDTGTTTGFDATFGTAVLSESGGNTQCMSDEECASGMCYLVGVLGGICSDCSSDADCDWGCSVPNPLADPPEGATCSDGDLSGGCESDGACMNPLMCATIIDIPGILLLATCSECDTDFDCASGQVCAPTIALEEIDGHNACVPENSKANGTFCELEGSAGAACASGYCGAADIMGLIELGVCSACSNAELADAGCGPDQSCLDPLVDLDGTVTPGTCVQDR